MRKPLIGQNISICPFCLGKEIVKKGIRGKKFERVQLYFCKHCDKVFSPQIVKKKHIPLRTILEGLSLYHLGHSLKESCSLLKNTFGISVQPKSLSNWVSEYRSLCTYSRMRPFGLKLFSPHQVVQSVSLYHRQIYKFRVHQAKLKLLLQEDIRNQKFDRLKEFLEYMYAECPHYLFQEGIRASEVRANFSLERVVIREKTNFANRLAGLLLQAVSDNKLRHETLQRFMLCNDSVTVATEVPVYLLPEDLEHMQAKLGFEIPLKIDKVLTGHIDILQIRNGAVYILDYKANAAKEKPIAQLTLYALALSRLTGLRLFEMKCGWFNEKNYFEFFPLHVVYKKRKKTSVKHLSHAVV